MASNPNYYGITFEIEALATQSLQNSSIDAGDYMRYDVKRGPHDLNGKGVLVGLTEISDIIAKKMADGQEIPCDGKLYYRGIDVEKLMAGAPEEGRFGFEEIAYLLLLDRLPNTAELESFKNRLAYYRASSGNFMRDVILEAPSQDIMNSLARSVLNLVFYDERCDDISLSSVMYQCLQLIVPLLVLSIYDYQAYTYKSGNSLYIYAPQPELSTAGNILSLLRPDSSYFSWEAHVLDICLTLHTEHGDSNNSTFTTHVVTSSGTDIYFCMTVALVSLKGLEHGGVNIKVIRMFEDMKEQMKDWKDEDEVCHYLQILPDEQALDRTGLIYGMGHAVYSLSDSHANLLRSFMEKFSREKGRTEEYEPYSLVERLGPEIIAGEWKMYKGVFANVDLYSGFVYHMLDPPLEPYTPSFAMARIAGWSTHRIKELINMSETIRPAYKCVGTHADYVPIAEW